MASRVLPLILFTSAVFALCLSQVPPPNVPSDQCVAPTLDYSVTPGAGSEAVIYIYSMSPFTSSCSGRVVGYWFCYQSPSSTTGDRVNISTVLLLEDMGTDYTIVRRFTVEVIPGRDCPSGGLCCVSRNLSAENQFGVNSSYLYGVVDLSGGPNMRQTIGGNSGRCGYEFNTAGLSTQSGDTLRRSGSPTVQPLKIFQFIIDNSTSDTNTPTTSTGAPPPTDTPPTCAPPPTDTPSTVVPPPTDTPSTGAPPPSSPSTSSTSPTTQPQPLQTPLLAGVGAALGVLLVMVVVIIVVIVIIVVVMRRNKGFALQQSAEGPAFMSAVYSGVGNTGKAAELSLPSSAGTRGNSYVGEPQKYGKYKEPPHEYSTPDEIQGNRVRTVPQHYEYAIVSQRQDAPPPQLGEYSYAATPDATSNPQGRRELHNSSTGIYMTPARDETSLYAQFRAIKIKQISRDAVKVVDHLGSGQFGTVDRGAWRSPEGDVPVAVKTLNPGVKEEDRVKFLQEAAIMGQFSHPNVVKLYGVVTTEQPMMIVLELLPKGDLRNALLSMKTDYEEEVDRASPQNLLSYCRQVAAGMCYLSQKSFVHRDLAARNILVAEDGICKVADFGMSRDLADENYYISHGGKIPVKWTAPEALNFKKYSTASDVWSYGALMYEIWSLGHKPFEGYTNAQAMKEVDRGYRLPPPPGCPKAMYELMIQCWHPETSGRPTFAGILQKLSLPDLHLLQWSEANKAVHPEASILGAKLEAATDLYTELQQSYLLDKDYETPD